MRLTSSLTLLAAAVAASSLTLVSSTSVTLPNLYACTPADIRVKATGNYTIEGRDNGSHKLVFRAHVNKGVKSVTWSAVELPANATALITVTDQTGPSPTQTTLASASAVVFANPIGNYTCLAKDHDSAARDSKSKNMVPTIIGIALGAFFLLIVLLVGGVMWRRKKEKMQKVENDSVDLNHSYAGNVPAGGSYMARLVPGLKLQEARPLPRDPVLESEQANYSNTRRGTMNYYKNGTDYNNAAATGGFYTREGLSNNAVAGGDRPYTPPQQHQQQGGGGYYPNLHQQQQQQQWGTSPHPSPHYAGAPPAAGGANPFASQADHQPMYQQDKWDQSQTSFLSKKSSH